MWGSLELRVPSCKQKHRVQSPEFRDIDRPGGLETRKRKTRNHPHSSSICPAVLELQELNLPLNQQLSNAIAQGYKSPPLVR